MTAMFRNASSFNHDLSTWNVSIVTNMSAMFYRAVAFNQDLSTWNVSNVTSMNYMFYRATSFNQDLSTWNMGYRTDTSNMFSDAIMLQPIFTKLKVSSFFDEIYLRMSVMDRKLIFHDYFPWNRRKAFVLFLVNSGYIYCKSISSNFESQTGASCDIIFDVEDIVKYICTFI
jgi:surface protein